MTSSEKSKVLFISTFPPKKCGIASFTQDLINAIHPETKEDLVLEVCALDRKKHERLYEFPVTMETDGHELDQFLEKAAIINNNPSLKLVCIEHEFGLYGGELGEYLLGFLTMLEKPIIARFHTVLPDPSPKMLKVVQGIALLADHVIVMTQNSARLLREHYHIAPDKIMIIPHGTHANSQVDAKELKRRYGLENKQVLTTFGLLSPNKGIEKGILAMKRVSVVYPDAIYLVLGQTHPNLLEQEGEKYRTFLQELITSNGLEKNVRLVNEYVPTEKLMEYLALTDIYLFTSKDPDQAVSGTFLYAMSAGCAIISNSFVLAKEMLDDETGIILTSGQEHELSESIIRILNDPALQKKMSANAFMKTRNTSWKKVGQKHANLFHSLLRTSPAMPQLSNHYITK